jgi:hypothetical protein
LPVIRASGGRAFFTSLRALDQAQVLLSEQFKQEGLIFPFSAREPGRVLNYSSAFANWATPSCWAANRSGKAWT